MIAAALLIAPPAFAQDANAVANDTAVAAPDDNAASADAASDAMNDMAAAPVETMPVETTDTAATPPADGDGDGGGGFPWGLLGLLGLIGLIPRRAS
jgi:MYXO-CTERM domain-containing protein